jgi:Site-specific recombinase XerC
MTANSTTAKLVRKPHPDFPLFPHQSGRWAKKVRGKLHYFGKTANDPQGAAALNLWLEQKDDLLAGRKPRTTLGGLDVGALCNHFLTAKLRLLRTGEITPRTFDDYRATTDRVVADLGARRLVADLRADDFDKLRSGLARSLGPVALSNSVQRIRSVFHYAFLAELIDRPVRFGPTFKRPSKKSIRLARAERGSRLFKADELRVIMDAADTQLKAMILLAINGGLGNSDVASLPFSALDLEGGWLSFPRPKTGIDRRIPLWPDTVAAMKAAIDKRPVPKDSADHAMVFITKHGHNWGKLGKFDVDIDFAAETLLDRGHKRISSNNSLSKEFRKLAKVNGVNRTFYDLRHTFRTIADEAKDQPAADAIMGHADESMAAVYRERISDERLRAVTDHVHDWLFGKPKRSPRQSKPGRQKAK